MELAKYYILLRKRFFYSIIAALTSLILSGCTSDQGEKFSRQHVDTTAYGKPQEDTHSSLLQKYVDSDRYIHYADWKKSPQDLQSLKTVLTAMTQADTTSMSLDGKKAFYINAYNAMTIDLVLNHYEETLGGTGTPYPTARSIRNIGNLDDKVWDFYKWQIGGQSVSLNDIENKILRPMGDARIHFAIVCASKGCPPILNKAFTEQTINQTLDQVSDDFVNSERNTKISVEKNEIKTSRILEWFSQDFINSYGSVKNFLAKFSQTTSADQIQRMKLEYNIYDWLLNESSKPLETLPVPENKIPSETENSSCDDSVGSGSENPPECPPPTPPGSGSEELPSNQNTES